jgi:hypothetical protein
MGEKPIPERPSLFIQVFCLGDQIQFGDIYPRGTDHIAEVTPNTEINPFINRGFTWPSESFSAWACLFWSWKERGDPRDRADRHADSATNTDIRVIFRPRFLIFHIVGLKNVVATFRLRYFTQAKACDYCSYINIIFYCLQSDRDVPRKPRPVGGVPACRQAGRGTI